MSMQQIIADLDTLRRHSRAMLLVQRLAVLAAWVIAALLVLIGIDYLLRMPGTLRLVLLLGAVGALCWAIWRYLLVAIRFHPTLTQLALRVEQAMPALAGRLASSVEFAAAGVDRGNVLAARSVRDVDARMRGETMRTLLRPAPTLRDLGIFLAVAAIAASFVAASPAAARTGLLRIVLPYSDAQWPARTGVQSLMSETITAAGVHPRGQALPLRAEVTRGENSQRVHANYRLQTDGSWQQWQQVVLTQQGEGPVHERLIDSSAQAVEVYFSTADDRTDVQHIDIVPPPEVRSAHLRISPPAYARSYVNDLQTQLGPGTDSRARTDEPSLIGSQVEFVLQMNKPLPAPRTDSALRVALGWGEQPLPSFDVDDTGSTWTLRWQLQGERAIALQLLDEHGLANAEPIDYEIDAVEDHPPSVTITEPQADEAVLASAVVDLVAESQDDVALSRLWLEARLQDDEDAPVRWSQEQSTDAPGSTIEAVLDLSTLDLTEGDIVLVQAAAQDVYALDGERHEPATSPTRRLRILSELDFATQLRRQLGVVRQNAVRMETMQVELQDAIEDDGVQPGNERAQAQIAQRIAAQREAVNELRNQMQQNRLDDDQLESLMDQAGDLLDYAGRAANEAVEQIAQQQATQSDDAQEIAQAQQEVREELADLIELLDRDEDTWVITRQLEQLQAEQEELREQTQRLQQRTLGQSLEDLAEADLTELERIARAQRDLRDEARQAVDDLRRRADAMEQADPQAASAMRDAADTAEQRELDRDMQNAAQRTRQNQLRSAQAGQNAASRTMQRMLDDIEQSQQAEVEQLLRQLASLTESIERLIFVQENEITALTNAIDSGNFAGRDRAMIRLNQNTQAVASEARAAGQQTRRIARTLDRAADAQGAAVEALRQEPVATDDAEAAEQRSLELLSEARTLAEELEQQTREQETQRKREELMQAYRELMQTQVALRTDVLSLAEHDQLNRRQLVEARRLGSGQDDLRSAMDDLQQSQSDVLDSAIFSHVHQRIGRWSQTVSESLAEGNVGVSVTDRQGMIAQSIARLIEALEQSMQQPDAFAENGQQDGGGEGGSQGGEQPLIPPIAELRLLRGLQEEVYNQTQQLDSRSDLDDAQRRQRLRDLGELQRELMQMSRDMLEQMQ